VLKQKLLNIWATIKLISKILFVASFVWVLFYTKILYYEFGNGYIKLGASFLTESVEETIRNSDKAILEADLLLEDARKRGILY